MTSRRFFHGFTLAFVSLAVVVVTSDAAPKTIASGTQTTVVGTLHALATINAAGTYVFKLSTCTLLSGDTLEARVLDKVIQTGPLEGYIIESWSGAQSVDECAEVSVPFSPVYQSQVSIKQTAGSSRSVRWSVVQINN